MIISYLANTIDADDTTLQLMPGDGVKCPQNQVFHIMIGDEIFLVNSVSTDLLNISRGHDGSPTSTHTVGDPIHLILKETHLKNLNTYVDTIATGDFKADGTIPMTGDIDFAGTAQCHDLAAPAAAGEAIRQTAVITEASVDDAIDKAHSNSLDHTQLCEAADFSKLDGIEALADVTDATNVAAAGAVMHTLADAANDFLVADGANSFVKKTLAETKTILGISAGATIAFPGTEVYADVKTSAFADLDLSAVTGANSALVALRVIANTCTGIISFRKNGEASTPYGGTGYANITTAGGIAYLSVPTDSAGVVEWAATMVSTQKLVGRDDVAASGQALANYLCMTKFTAGTTAKMFEFQLRASGNGNVKAVLYADSAGAPGALLGQVGSTAVTAGVNKITFASTAITSGTAYWLGFNSDTAVVGYKTEASTRKFKSLAFASAFPDPAGAGYTADTANCDIVSGWGGSITVNVESYAKA